MAGEQSPVRGVIFDKDGTLLDFHATWDAVIGGLLRAGANGDDDALAGMANAIGYDLESETIVAGSPVIAESNETIAGLLSPWVAPADFHRIGAGNSSPPVAMAGAPELLSALQGAGVAMAVATNDGEQIARRQMDDLGWLSFFGAVVGFDSGHGGKPDPGMVIAAADLLGLPVGECVMVGDSPHDILAGRAAGMRTASLGANPQARAPADVQFDTLPQLQAWLNLRP